MERVSVHIWITSGFVWVMRWNIGPALLEASFYFLRLSSPRQIAAHIWSVTHNKCSRARIQGVCLLGVLSIPDHFGAFCRQNPKFSGREIGNLIISDTANNSKNGARYGKNLFKLLIANKGWAFRIRRCLGRCGNVGGLNAPRTLTLLLNVYQEL